MFSARIPLPRLVELCRVLHHNLGAGLPLVKVYAQQAERGSSAVRPAARRIHARLKQGNSLGAALEHEQATFPPLFIALVRVGEQTGHLAEIFGELEDYFLLQDRLKKQFISQSILPAVQFVFAIFVIAGLILVLGLIASSRGGTPPTIFGLSGARGALVFLVSTFGTLALLFFVVKQARRHLSSMAQFDALLLRVPALGPCLEALALNRLALCLQLTLDSGLPIAQGVQMSLEASANAALQANTAEVLNALKKGRTLSEALAQIRSLPGDFLHMVAVAEEGGRVPEMMKHQAAHYQEEAGRRLTLLTRAASFLLWLVYAGFMIFAIFTIAQMYLSGLGV